MSRRTRRRTRMSKIKMRRKPIEELRIGGRNDVMWIRRLSNNQYFVNQ